MILCFHINIDFCTRYTAIYWRNVIHQCRVKQKAGQSEECGLLSMALQLHIFQVYLQHTNKWCFIWIGFQINTCPTVSVAVYDIVIYCCSSSCKCNYSTSITSQESKEARQNAVIHPQSLNSTFLDEMGLRMEWWSHTESMCSSFEASSLRPWVTNQAKMNLWIRGTVPV